MTGRTHDLAAFTAASFLFVTYTPAMSLGTLLTSLGAVFIGGLYPDLDSASSDFWEKFPGGSLIGRLVAPFLGGHRLISHSLVGLVLTGFGLNLLLGLLNTVLLVTMDIVWIAFMAGYVSHLLADSLTKDGIPLFFPFAYTFGIPPLRILRMKTGSRWEKYIVYPLLLLYTGYLYLGHYHQILEYFQNHLH